MMRTASPCCQSAGERNNPQPKPPSVSTIAGQVSSGCRTLPSRRKRPGFAKRCRNAPKDAPRAAMGRMTCKRWAVSGVRQRIAACFLEPFLHYHDEYRPPLAEDRPCCSPLCARDRPNSLEARLATREAHISYLTTYEDRLVEVGPLLDEAGRPCGSLLIVDVEDRAAAEGFAAADPYNKVDLFESVVIRGYRTVFRDGRAVG